MKQQKERPVWKLFFDLLKVTTGNRDQLPVVPTAEAWHTIYQLASQQALVGVLYGGINRLPKEQLPPQDLLLKWYAMARQIEQCNEQLNAECVEVARYLTQQGYDYAILKGQSLASLYPQPQLRTPGDIDVFASARLAAQVACRGASSGNRFCCIPRGKKEYYVLPHPLPLLSGDRGGTAFYTFVDERSVGQPPFASLFLGGKSDAVFPHDFVDKGRSAGGDVAYDRV